RGSPRCPRHAQYRDRPADDVVPLPGAQPRHVRSTAAGGLGRLSGWRQLAVVARLGDAQGPARWQVARARQIQRAGHLRVALPGTRWRPLGNRGHYLRCEPLARSFGDPTWEVRVGSERPAHGGAPSHHAFPNRNNTSPWLVWPRSLFLWPPPSFPRGVRISVDDVSRSNLG